MTIYIVPAALLILTAGIGLPMRRYGKNALFCVLFGVMLFAAPFIHTMITGPAPVISGTGSPIGLRFISAISSYTEIKELDTALMSAICAVCAALFVYRRCADVPAGAAMFAACGVGLILGCGSSPMYAAAMICLACSRFVYETRFFRFAAFVLLAACFDIRALLLLPAFFLCMIRKPWITLIVSAAAAVPLMMFPVGDTVFGFLPDTQETPAPLAEYALPMAAMVTMCVFALLGTLIHKLFGKDNDDALTNLNLLIYGCLFAALSYTDARYAPLALYAALPSLTSLGAEIYSVGGKLITGTFRNSKESGRTALLAWNGICFAAAAVILAAVMLSGGFGLSADGSTLGEVV